MKKFKFILVVLLYLGLNIPNRVNAQSYSFYNTPVFNDSIIGNQITNGANKLIYADYLSSALNATSNLSSPANISNVSWRPNLTFKSSDGFVVLRLLNPSKGFNNSNFNTSVTIQVKYYRWNPNSNTANSSINELVTDQITLSVGYDSRLGKSYKEKDFYRIPWAHAVSISVVSVSNSSLIDNVVLETEIRQERYNNNILLSEVPTFNSSDQCTYLASSNEIKFKFHPTDENLKFATEYDFEWTFIEAYNSNGNLKTHNGAIPDDLFRFNSSRVTIKNTEFTINNVFEVGYIYYRVRAVGKYYSLSDNKLKRVECDWSDVGYFTINSQASNAQVVEHLKNLNWQYICTYAEDGKKKDVITYYDGSMRPRQAVTQFIDPISNEKLALVQDKIYDYQGRLAIEVLPTPVTSPILTFYPNTSLSLSGSNLAYSRLDFDLSLQNNNCATETKAMKLTSGAAKYYSANNDFKSSSLVDFDNYTPIADGFPFIQKLYTNDNTGRISKQSSPGLNHKVGSGHETEYIYTRPSQEELDRLFGTEAGLANHYQKNVVIDPNGQASVSYLNASGKVVATALSGKQGADINLNTLPGATNSTYNANTAITVDLRSTGDMLYSETGIESHFSFFVDKETDYKFYYSVSPQEYTNSECSINFCADCVYDLEISLKNQCDEEQLIINGINSSLKKQIGNMPNQSNYSTCSNDGLGYSLSNDFSQTSEGGYITVHLERGTYTLSKRLEVNKTALDFYTEKYLEDITNSGTCKKLTDFQTEAQSALDLSGCNLTCEPCLQKIGLSNQDLSESAINTARSSYINTRLGEMTALGKIPTSTDSELITQSFNYLLENCKILCKTSIDQCEIYKQILIGDMLPGGQYAKYKTETVNGVTTFAADDKSGDDIWNIFGNYNTSANVISYQNVADYPEFSTVTVDVIENDELVTKFAYLLTPSDFIKYFKNEWAELYFIKRHPEFCQLQKCSTESASFAYTSKMLETETYEEALSENLLAPIYVSNGDVISRDPFFQFSDCGSSKKNSMKQSLDRYISTPKYRINGGRGTTAFDDLEVILSPNTTGGVNVYNKNNKPTVVIGTISNYPTSLTVKNTSNVTMGTLEELTLPDGSVLRRIVTNTAFYHYKMTDIPLMQLYCSDLKPNQSKKIYDCVKDARAKITNNSSTCDDIQDRYWLFYRALYLGKKEQYSQELLRNGANSCKCDINISAFASSDPILRREKRFYPTFNGESEFFKDALGNTLNPSVLVTNNNAGATKTNVVSAINAQCDETCRSYANYWMSKIENCSTANSLLSKSQKDAMINELINVCKNGCDEKNVLGSSTVNPIYLNNPNVVNKSFHDVFTNYLGGVYVAGLCDELLIKVPKPYGHDYLATSSPFADTCSCNQVNNGYYKINGASRCPSPTPTTSASCACTNTSISKVTKQSLLMGSDVEDAKKCNTCIGCLDLAQPVRDFFERYPQLTESSTNFSMLFTNYLNNHLNMNLTYTDYMGLITNCTNIHTLGAFRTQYSEIYLTDNKQPSSFSNWEIVPTRAVVTDLALNGKNAEIYYSSEKVLLQSSQTWSSSFSVEYYNSFVSASDDNKLTYASLYDEPIIFNRDKHSDLGIMKSAPTDNDSPPDQNQNGTEDNSKCGCDKIFDIWKNNPTATDDQLSQLFADQYNGGEKYPNFAELKKQCCKAYNGQVEGFTPEDLPEGEDIGDDPDIDITPDLPPTNCTINFGTTPSQWTSNWSSANLDILKGNLAYANIKFPNSISCSNDKFVDECGCDALAKYKSDYDDKVTNHGYNKTFEEYVNEATGNTGTIPDLDMILEICSKIKTEYNTSTTGILWNQTSAAALKEMIVSMNLKLPSLFKCPDQPNNPPPPNGGCVGCGVVYPDPCVNTVNLSCTNIYGIINSAFSSSYTYLNDLQANLLSQQTSWSTVLAAFKTAIAFGSNTNCLIAINFNQDFSTCGNTRVYTAGTFYVNTTATDAELTNLLKSLLVYGCGCAPQSTWTPLTPRVSSECPTCYGASKALLGVQKFLNEVATQVDETKVIDGTTVVINKFNATTPQTILSTSAFVSHVYNGTSPSTLAYKRIGITPFFENALKLNISDGNTFSKEITLNFMNTNPSNRVYYIRRFFNIRPSCPSPNGNFDVDVEMDLYDVSVTGIAIPIRVVRKMQGTIDGFTLAIEYNCCAKVCNKPALDPEILVEEPCGSEQLRMAEANALLNYTNYMNEKRNTFRKSYLDKCLTVRNFEVFKMKYNTSEYHYTLYYYDQAGNLTKTVPPKGVDILDVSEVEEVKQARLAYDSDPQAPLPLPLPQHTLVTYYQYNTLNQLIWQSTPDGGVSQFYYDQLGRIVFSQNAKQKLASPTMYSYTRYDLLGRITEVGEIDAPELVNHTKSRNPELVNNIIREVLKMEVTKTYYDQPAPQTVISSALFTQSNLRNRVSYTTIQDNSEAAPKHLIFYNYDVHGNVSSIGRQINDLASVLPGQEFKFTNYYYDLVSGKVNQVVYQENEADQFIHNYQYDYDNRLTSVLTGQRPELFEYDAYYQYYKHGPLARVELGEQLVQGVDYAYTISGWLKAVNSGSLNPEREMGKDGLLANTDNLHRYVAKDAFGFVLDYFAGDYTPTNNTTPFNSFIPIKPNTSNVAQNTINLYNGNIVSMTTAIGRFMQNGQNPLYSSYQYDQLNRLASATYYNNFDAATNTWLDAGQALLDYQNVFTYDAMGNILTQKRNGSRLNGYDLDDMTYEYYPNTNRLKRVTDNVSKVAYPDDIDSQVDNNYEYDAIGNLTKDKAEEIASIEWNVYGKIKRITRVANSTKPDLEFEYSPDGHRTVKIVTPKTGGYVTYTYYVRDAQGNIMATYDRKLNKVVDYSRLTYASVNDKLAQVVGDAGFAAFMSSLHGNQIVNTGLNNAVLSAFNANTAQLVERLREMNPNDVLYGSDSKFLQWVLSRTNAETLLTNLIEGGEAVIENYLNDLCNCANNGYTWNTIDVIAQNPSYLKSFFRTLCRYDEAFSTTLTNDIQMAVLGAQNCPADENTLNSLDSKLSSTSAVYHTTVNDFKTAVLASDLANCEQMSRLLLLMYKGEAEDKESFFKILADLPQNTITARVNNLCSCGSVSISSLANTTTPLQQFLLALYTHSKSDYDGLLTALGESTNAVDLPGIISSGINQVDLVAELSNIGITACSTKFKEVLYRMYLNNPSDFNSFINQNFVTASYNSSCITSNGAYACPDLGTYVSDISSLYTNRTLWDELLALESASFYSTWYKNNALPEFYKVTAKYHRAAISTYQQNNNMYDIAGNGMYTYFNHIKAIAGTTVYDNLVTYFMGISNTYMDTLKLSEWMVYGSSRLGTINADLVVAAVKLDALASGPNLSAQNYFSNSLYQPVNAAMQTRMSLVRGIKRYELSNHLGNVLAVVTDKKIPEYANQTATIAIGYTAEVLYANDYSPFGAPMPNRSYAYNKFDAVVVDLPVAAMSTTGWQTSYCTSPTSCTTPENSVSLSITAEGKLRMQATKRYSQMYYTFTTIPGRVYRVKYKLSNSTMAMVNASVFAPVAKAELYTTANITTFTTEREMLFTATETTTRFYITKGWSVAATTATQQVDVDYVTILELPSQINYITCISINENLTMLANAGVNINDSVQVRNSLNSYYNRSYSYEAYSQVLSGCANNTLTYVLAQPGAEAQQVEDGYRFGFNGKEKDDEVVGAGNAYDYGARIYDPRLGRWFSVDPLQYKYPFLSPYQFCANSPIAFKDADGRIIVDANGNEVKVTIVKNDDGTIKEISYEFAKGTSQKVKDDFYNNAGVLFSLLGETKSGVAQLEKAIQVDTRISFKIDPGESKNDKSKDDGRNKNDYLGWTWNPIKIDKNGVQSMDKDRVTEITIYKGTIERYQKKPGSEESEYSVEEIMAYTTGHEIEHTTDENRMIAINKHNKPNLFQQSAEKKPEIVEAAIKEEIKAKK